MPLRESRKKNSFFFSNPDVKGLITTGEGKFYSNGIDLDWLGKQNGDVFRRFMINLHALSVRLLTFPMVTVAAINGRLFHVVTLMLLMANLALFQKNAKKTGK